MTKKEIWDKIADMPDNAEVMAEHAELGEGENIISAIIDVVVSDDKIIFVTEHTI